MSFIYLALIAAAVMQIVGWAWHMPLFGKIWMWTLGVDPSVKHDMTGYLPMWASLVINFVINFIMAFVFFFLLGVLGAPSFVATLIVGAIVLIGFIMPIMISNALWGGRKTKQAWAQFGVSFGYQIIQFLIMCALFIWLA